MRDDIKRGDIFYIEPYYTVGSEQHAGRPAIIVSNDANNRYSGTYEAVYLTTKEKTTLPTHVKIASAPLESTALCEQIDTISDERIGDRCGRATDDEMWKIDKALAVSIGIANKPQSDIECDAKLSALERRYNKLRAMYDDLFKRFIEDETEAS